MVVNRILTVELKLWSKLVKQWPASQAALSRSLQTPAKPVVPLVSAGATTVTTTPSPAASATVWMRTWSAGTITWTWQALKTTRLVSEPVSGRRPGGGGSRRKGRLWPFEAASRAPHYCSTCLEPLGKKYRLAARAANANIWVHTGTMHQVLEAEAVLKWRIELNKLQPWSAGQWWHVIVLMLPLDEKC